MAILSWGKPKIEMVKLENGEIPSSPTWIRIDNPVENSTKLSTQRGEKKPAKGEGGVMVDVRTARNEYTIEFELYAKKGKSKPIEDDDGVVIDHYAFRLTPEDETVPGFQAKKVAVSVEDTWDSEIGGKWKYSLDVLSPESGKKIEPYTA